MSKTTRKNHLVSILTFVIFALLAIITITFGSTNSSAHSTAENQTNYEQLPPLQDEKAINYLKETKQFDSFSQAVAATDFTQQAKLTATDGISNDTFGSSVSISGNTAAVGVPQFGIRNLKGAVYIFIRNGAMWIQQARLEASDGITGDRFGVSVAIEGDTLIVGAYGAFVGENSAQGQAYVFIRSGSTWTQQQKLVASDGVPDGTFGIRIRMNGNTLIIGTNSAVKAAYIFVRSGTVWTQQQKLSANDSPRNFGARMAIDGDTCVVSGSDSIEQRTAYIFVRSGTIWTQQQKITANEGGEFGTDIVVYGNTLFIGAPSVVVNGIVQGAVYVFTRNGDTWTQQQKLVGSGGQANDDFGASIAFNRQTLVIGAYGFVQPGSVYIFTNTETGWKEEQKIQADPSVENNRFGVASISNNTIIVGASNDMVGGVQQGAAYIFTANRPTQFDFDGDGKADVSVYRPSNGVWYLLNSQSGFSAAQFGISADKIVPADYDGDGKADIAVYREGAWYLLRSTSGFTAVQFGTPGDIPMPADFNGDGKAELVVYRPSLGTWYVMNLANNAFNAVQFGIATDKPVVADYDGDGKADYAVYRPDSGVWYLLQSTAGFAAIQFGNSTDKPVVGDYDGDGKADEAVFRPSNGTWYLFRSRDGFAAFQFGISADLSVPADYDGDGKTDAAVFRDGTWYQQKSTQGFGAVQFGLSTDKPIQNSFVP